MDQKPNENNKKLYQVEHIIGTKVVKGTKTYCTEDIIASGV